MANNQTPLLQRFWSRVTVGPGCWLWTGPCAGGYGSIKRNGVHVATHRLVWEWAYGSIPDGILVCHACDTPRCVRPDHLFLGTDTDNQRDAWAKGRKVPPRGELNGTARLTAAQVLAIRKDGRGPHALAREYGVSYGCVSAILNRRSWRHLPP